MDLLNTFHFTHGELNRIPLISWKFLQKHNLWFWILDLESLAGGGSIICRVSSRNQHLPQSPSYPLYFLWFLSFGYLREKGGEYMIYILGMEEDDERSYIFKLLATEALNLWVKCLNPHLKPYPLYLIFLA
jgi:hypothetical protein